MRVMYDSVRASGCPHGAQLYAGYIDGNYQSYHDMVRLFPGAVHVSITVHGSPAQMCDVENGAMTPAGAANWVIARRVAGYIPTVYCSYSNVATVLAECHARRVVMPVQFAIADWDDSPNFPPAPNGAVFVSKQYRHDLHTPPGANYDISSVVDHWPGVDPDPIILPPLPPTPEEDDMANNQIMYKVDMTGAPAGSTDDLFWVWYPNSGIYVEVEGGVTGSAGNNYAAFTEGGAEVAGTITYPQHLALKAASTNGAK